MDTVSLKDKIEVILKRDEPVDGDGDEISLRDLIEALLKGKFIIAAFMVVAVLAAVFFVNYRAPYAEINKTSIAFNYQGIERGMDPHGRKLDIAIIRSPLIINEALLETGLNERGFTADRIRRNLDIRPIIPGNALRRLEDMRERETGDIYNPDDFVYYPNEFVISLNISKSWDFAAAEGRELLDAIIDNYILYFYHEYTDRSVLADATRDMNYEEYDYPEASMIIRNKIDIMESYLTEKNNQAPDFRSNSTGLSFGDIVRSINIIKTVDLNRLDSIIGAFKLTRDRDRLIRYYEYTIKRNELYRAKKEDEAQVVADMLDNFEKEKTMLLLPGMMGDGSFGGSLELMESSGSFYDELARQYTNAGINASSYKHETEFIRREIEEIEEFDYSVISEEIRQTAERDVIELMQNIDRRLNNWTNLTNETVDEYFETLYQEKAIMRLTPVESYSALENIRLIMAVALVLGLMLGVFFVFFKSYWENSSPETDNADGSPKGAAGVSDLSC